jgi:DNA-binding beta-propeller fold protein YncE
MLKIRRRRSYLTIAAGVALAAVLALPAAAPAQWATGDIVIADPDANAGAGTIFKVDPVSGAVSILATGPPLLDPTDVAIDAQGNILVMDEEADPAGLGAGTTGAVFRLAPGSAPAVLATSAAFVEPDGIAVDRTGNVIVGDNDADPNALAIDTGAVFRFAPGSAPQLIAASSQFEDPGDVAVGTDGQITVADDNANLTGTPEPPGTGTVFRFSPGAAPGVLASGPPLIDPDGVAIDAQGNTLVADDSAVIGSGTIFKIPPSGGGVTALATSTQFGDPEHVAIESDGRILVVDDAAEPSLFRVDPASGVVTPFAGSPLFIEPEGVAVVPPKCGGRFATIVGDDTKNSLKGTSGADVIWGGRGKDKIKGGKGADRICGDEGKDRLFGQQGKDRLFGGKGADKLRGGKGNDRLNGGKGKDDVQE